MDEERTIVQNAYGEDEGACEIANGQKKLTNGAVCMEICVFYFWFGDIYKSTAGVPNPNYLNKNTNTNVRMDPRYTGASW